MAMIIGWFYPKSNMTSFYDYLCDMNMNPIYFFHMITSENRFFKQTLKVNRQWSRINTITSHILPSIPKGNEGHTQHLTNAHERHTQLTEWTAHSQTGDHLATLIGNDSNIYFYLFLF